MKRLVDKVALVTGAARGVGKATARAFVENDAYVYVTDIDDALGSSIATSLGRAASYCRLDVREEADWGIGQVQNWWLQYDKLRSATPSRRDESRTSSRHFVAPLLPDQELQPVPGSLLLGSVRRDRRRPHG